MLSIVTLPLGGDTMLNNKLKELCARHHFTQIELARLVGVTRQTIGFIEKGEFSPSVTLSLKLACALDCDINELFWLEGDIHLTVLKYFAE